MAIVVFDLDHTLIRCDGFAGFTRRLILKSIWRTVAVLLIAPLLLLLCLPRRTRIWVGSSLVWFGTVGLNQRKLHALMDHYVEARFGGSSELVCVASLNALHTHQQQGARVFIATGCEAALALRICSKLGIFNVEVVGSTLKPWLGGWIAERHCYGFRKVLMLRERGAGESWDCVYSDSAADLPILSRGLRRIVVNPKPAHRKRIQQRLGDDIEVVEWR